MSKKKIFLWANTLVGCSKAGKAGILVLNLFLGQMLEKIGIKYFGILVGKARNWKLDTFVSIYTSIRTITKSYI